MTGDSFYSSNGKIKLPNHIKAYVDDFCYEYSLICQETKLLHLGFAIHNGYDLYKGISDYLDNHPEISEDSIKATICRYITSFRYSEDKRFYVDREGMTSVLTDQLSLEEATELFVIELKLRFSYKVQGNKIDVSQHYDRWSTLNELVKKYGEGYINIVTKPTGYKKITEQDIKELNHWPTLINDYYQDLYSETREHIYPEDYDIIETFNAKEKNRDYKIITGVPAEPWQGNPLNAKVIILSLNPGYVEKCNRDKALELHPHFREGIWSEKAITLKLEADGFLPYQQNGYTDQSVIERIGINNGIAGYADAMNVIGDFYWYDCLQDLNIELHQDEYKFFQNFALVQYCAYTSKKFKALPQILPSQELTKDLIRYITYNKPNTLFVIMRGLAMWEKLIDKDVWLKMQNRLIRGNNPHSKQYLSKNMLGESNFQRIVDALK